MTIDEKEKFLNSLFRKNDLIKSKNYQLRELRESASSISINYENETKSNMIGDKIGNSIAIIDELENELKSELEEYCTIAKEINNAIDTLENNTYKAVLSYRFVNFKSYEEIALILGYSTSRIYGIRKTALKLIDISS